MKLENTCTQCNTSTKQKKGTWFRGIIVAALALALACIPLTGCAGSDSGGSSAQQPSSSSTSTQAASKITVNVTVEGDHEGVAVNENGTAELDEGATALDALEASGLDVVVEDSSYGPYVTSIQGLKAEGSCGWMYNVNDESPTVSAGEYTVSDGDTVSWTYFVG